MLTRFARSACQPLSLALALARVPAPAPAPASSDFQIPALLPVCVMTMTRLQGYKFFQIVVGWRKMLQWRNENGNGHGYGTEFPELFFPRRSSNTKQLVNTLALSPVHTHSPHLLHFPAIFHHFSELFSPSPRFSDNVPLTITIVVMLIVMDFPVACSC